MKAGSSQRSATSQELDEAFAPPTYAAAMAASATYRADADAVILQVTNKTYFDEGNGLNGAAARAFNIYDVIDDMPTTSHGPTTSPEYAPVMVENELYFNEDKLDRMTGKKGDRVDPPTGVYECIDEDPMSPQSPDTAAQTASSPQPEPATVVNSFYVSSAPDPNPNSASTSAAPSSSPLPAEEDNYLCPQKPDGDSIPCFYQLENDRKQGDPAYVNTGFQALDANESQA